MTAFIGIDPGLDGAVAVIDASGAVEFHDAPTLTVGGKGGRRREYDLSWMARILRKYDVGAHAAIEQVGARPGQGVRSMFTMGYGVGCWHGLLAAFGIPYERVTPQRWKRLLMDGMGHDKDAARLKAIQLFPAAAVDLSRKRDVGRADALLIAEWLRRTVRA